LARSAVACLLTLAAACTSPTRPKVFAPTAQPAETWVIARDPAVARRVAAVSAPAIVMRADGTAASLVRTRVAVTIVGPIVTMERTSAYVLPHGQDVLVAFTPPGTPARQDLVMQVGARALTVHVREPAEAKALARATPGATLLATGADGLVAIPLGAVASREIDLRVQSTAVVPWRQGAYEVTVPRAPEGKVALEAEVYGPGPLVVMSSPSHAIDVKPVSLEHLRVALREPETLRDADLCLRYRVDPADRPGAFVVEPDGVGHVVGLVLHPFEASHEPVAVSDVTIDWNGAPVLEVRPASVGPVAAGTPVVVLARTSADVRDAITVRARVGRETRTLTLTRVDRIPPAGLASLWARAARVAVAAHR
jgi:hypothetical protein